ncbi:Rod shape-determining protein MreD [Reichenbachiella agarivorans]|uniref:Rod shape-determining protein MreD n=1 Tax=Reichenbachiella agarivorans TaxID=2979464 RepID=A0ABY6CZH1_9BACT|nr:Rod shape-determining protein MreD [Reichenbachiella agarivorans]UXP33630.1 Rod shape-determining protein MreD [Reichenbachiella agarivorans]
MGRFKFFEGIISVILLVLGQAVLFKNLVLFDVAFCFAYVMIFLLLSIETAAIVQLIYAFVMGMIIDIFYNTPGMHAAASLVFVFVKLYWAQAMTPSGGYDIGANINLKTQGLRWFVMYSYPLILVHSLVVFFVEAAGFSLFWRTITTAFYSSLFTLATILIIQYLFYKKVK